MLLNYVKKVKNKIFRKKRKKVRYHLDIKQDNMAFDIKGYLSNENYCVDSLWIQNRENPEEKIEVKNRYNNNDFHISFELNDYNEFFYDEKLFDLFLYVKVPAIVFSEKQMEQKEEEATIYIDESNEKFYYYPIRLGRFAETINTPLYEVTVNDNTLYLYKTVNGNITLAVNKEVNQPIITQIDKLKMAKGEITVQGKLFTRTHDIEYLKLIVLGRDNHSEYEFYTSTERLIEQTKKRFGLNRYTFHTNINLNEMVQLKYLQEDIYDVFFDVKFKSVDEIRRVRVGKPRFLARRKIRHQKASINGTTHLFNPYYTFRHLNLSIQVNNFPDESYKYLKRRMRWSWLLYQLNKKKDIWLIGERTHKAEDTGYHLFKYLRDKYPTKNIYYVIEKDSPELERVQPLGNILFYKSKEHIRAILIATRIIGSHHPDYLYPLRTDEFKAKVKGKKVFIQHGVMGTKNMVANYGKNATGFYTDLFLVSSNLEKQMIVDDFGYHQEDVAITGLSRFDQLFKDDIPQKRQLLIIPTWREWLVREDTFLESEYLERYSELIQSEQLKTLSNKYNFEVILYLHVNMQKYISYFQSEHVRIVQPGEVEVQHLLKESAMMITDYSSVAFDFSFLHKPIVYYQFDRNRFIGRRGSHLDLVNDLPGDIVYDKQSILDCVEESAKHDFIMKDKHIEKANKFITFKDQNSSERIYNAIKHHNRKKSFHEKIIETETYNVLFTRFRKSKRYFPTMKKLYSYMKRFLPVDEKLILFESGIGRQYSDSPRYIYEEIVRRNLDYKKVWVNNKFIRFDDPNTIRINRLSPSYYYYLAKAKYWVNNQNFPAYIEKRPETTYIQTWHGTPLKKMLHDIENVMGRSDGYIERISNAIEFWDYLISPSSYATKCFKSAFQYKNDILEVGYPRNDIFYQNNKNLLMEQTLNRLNIPKDKKIILYAPTFRDNQAVKNNRFKFDIEMDLYKMKEKLGEDYIVLLRLHVAITSKMKLDDELKDFVFDVSAYSEMQELLLVTDILITDYSSVMFDFANTKKPMIFFTYDIETYRDDVRGFYMDFENEAPGPLVEDTESIIKHIQNIDNLSTQYKEKYNMFYEKYCSLEDGDATNKIVDKFFV